MKKNSFKIKGGGFFEGEAELPGDKSISHRTLIFSSLAEGSSFIENLSTSRDVHSTIRVLKSLGVKISFEKKEGQAVVEGRAGRFIEPQNVLNCGNSGTTSRIMTGVLSGQKNIFCVLTGDSSLRKRPMARVVIPLKDMGASITGREKGRYLPISIHGKKLRGRDFEIPVASAQVKTSLIMAGLQARGETSVKEPFLSRDHTERLLPFYDVNLKRKGLKVIVEGEQILKSFDYKVPGDISSACFLIAGTVLCKTSKLKIKNVLLNKTRDGFLSKIKEMGAKLKVILKQEEPERIGDVEVKYGSLKAVNVKPREVPSLIDELPLLAVIAVFAEGRTIIKGAGELRVKESDRIRATATFLRKMGAKIEELEDGFIIEGTGELKGAEVNSFGDHRIAMAEVIAGCAGKGETIVKGSDCVNISFPEFWQIIKKLYKTNK